MPCVGLLVVWIDLLPFLARCHEGQLNGFCSMLSFTVLGSISVDIRSQWKENWKLVQVVNFFLVDDPTSRQPGFSLPQQQWSLLNRFHDNSGPCLTVSGLHGVTAVPVRKNVTRQPLICVLMGKSPSLSTFVLCRS